MNYKKYFLISLIIALVGCALVGIYIFLFGDWDETEEKVFWTTTLVAFYSLLGFCCSFQQNRKNFKWLSIVGILFSLIALFLSIYAIWGIDMGKFFWKVTGISTITAFSIAHVSLILLIKPKSKAAKYTLITTIVFIIIVTGLLINAVICDFDLADRCLRILGVFVILDVLGTITTPIMNILVEKK